MMMDKNLQKFLELHPGIDPNKAEFFYVILQEIGEMQKEEVGVKNAK